MKTGGLARLSESALGTGDLPHFGIFVFINLQNLLVELWGNLEEPLATNLTTVAHACQIADRKLFIASHN